MADAAVAAGLLGPVQRGVGAVEHVLRTRIVARHVRVDADAGGEGRCAARVRAVRLAAQVGQIHVEGGRDGRRGLGGGFRQQHGEFVATQPCDEIPRPPRAAAQDAAERLQRGIARGMALTVVQLLEVVDVHHQQRQRLSAAARHAQLLVQGLVEARAVGQSGECVGLRLLVGLPQQTVDP